MAEEDDQVPQEEQAPAPARAPWTIKGVSRETRDLVMEAAARRWKSVGTWLVWAGGCRAFLPAGDAADQRLASRTGEEPR